VSLASCWQCWQQQTLVSSAARKVRKGSGWVGAVADRCDRGVGVNQSIMAIWELWCVPPHNEETTWLQVRRRVMVRLCLGSLGTDAQTRIDD
jgi:hypothetical protein